MEIRLNNKQKTRLENLFYQKNLVENEISKTLFIIAEAMTDDEIEEVEVSKDLDILNVKLKKENENE